MPKKILIAEDEKPIANALFNKLKSEGFKVKLAGNGQEALDFLAKEQFNYGQKRRHKGSGGY